VNKPVNRSGTEDPEQGRQEQGRQGPDDPESDNGPAPQRLSKILSAHGVTSRREAEVMIRSGRVSVGGKQASIGQSARPGVDEIAVDGIPLAAKSELLYIMLNKPRGYVTTVSDERGRSTVMDLVTGAGTRLFPVGRLDYDSEGLILLTNDGRFAFAVAHPSFNVKKTYEIRARGDIRGAAERLRCPMEIDGKTVRAVSVRLMKRTAAGGLLQVTISEGRNRQVRKMCALCGLSVLSLKRISIGSLELGSLKPGQWRFLTESERKALCRF